MATLLLLPVIFFLSARVSDNNLGKIILVVQRYRDGMRAHIHTEDEWPAAAAKEDFVSFSLRKEKLNSQWFIIYLDFHCILAFSILILYTSHFISPILMKVSHKMQFSICQCWSFLLKVGGMFFHQL